ncbi:XdhC family protein [Nocardia brasiliensis]|uniref:XdhC family protein n=1 Tax=Nocardia brasiliensis TaxID=37326 RepID=UPI003D8D7074
MRNILDELHARWSRGEVVVSATIVAAFASTPRAAGVALCVGADGEVTGSLSGGCVDGAVSAAAEQVMGDGRPVLQHYGDVDAAGFAIGLACGGAIDVFLERVDRRTMPELGPVVGSVRAGRPVAMVTVIEDQDGDLIGRRMVVWEDHCFGTFGDQGLDAAVLPDARVLLSEGHTSCRRYRLDTDGQRRAITVFVNCFEPAPRLLVFGISDYAVALTHVGSYLGYRVTVCDARPAFATSSRFRDAAEVVVEWPHRYLEAEAAAGRLDHRTVLAVLTHDPRFEIPLLCAALGMNVEYVGAMGSRGVHDRRMAQLRAHGVPEKELSRLCSPIGLDLGAGTPAETAISIMAEIVASRTGGSGQRLVDSEGAIHRRSTAPIPSAG